MKYILGLKFEEQPFYVRINNDNTWDEILNPHCATIFTSKKTALTWTKDNTTFREYAVALPATVTKEEYDKYISTGAVRRSFELVNNVHSRKYANESPIEILQWRIDNLYIKESLVRFEDYTTWPDLHQVFSNLWGTESYWSKDYTEKWHTVQMCVRPDSNLETFTEELRLILPHITFMDDGYKLISIFDRFLHEDGGVVFHYKSDDDCFLQGHYERNIQPSNISDVFDYWKRERYYG